MNEESTSRLLQAKSFRSKLSGDSVFSNDKFILNLMQDEVANLIESDAKQKAMKKDREKEKSKSQLLKKLIGEDSDDELPQIKGGLDTGIRSNEFYS